MGSRFQWRSGVVWPRELEGEVKLGISSHILSVVGEQVKGREINARQALVGGMVGQRVGRG